jgi:hypothetical protein
MKPLIFSLSPIRTHLSRHIQRSGHGLLLGMPRVNHFADIGRDHFLAGTVLQGHHE